MTEEPLAAHRGNAPAAAAAAWSLGMPALVARSVRWVYDGFVAKKVD